MSKRLISSACAAVLSFAVAMAQTAGTRTPTDRANRTDTKPVAILGCVARGPAVNQIGQFVLNNASMSTGATGQAGSAGSVGAGGVEAVGIIPGGVTGATSTDHPRTLEPEPVGPSGTATSYVLIPGRTNLTMWVGQRVEVTGTIGSAPSAGNMPRLQVVSVRPVQGNCL